MAPVFLPPGAQSCDFVSDRAVVFVPREVSVYRAEDQSERATFGACDQRCAGRNDPGDERNFRVGSLPFAPVDCYRGGGLGWRVALLRAASVRRRLLGASRGLGLHGG